MRCRWPKPQPNHAYENCVCIGCGQKAPAGSSVHSFDGCICTTCGLSRDVQHVFDKDLGCRAQCAKCGKSWHHDFHRELSEEATWRRHEDTKAARPRKVTSEELQLDRFCYCSKCGYERFRFRVHGDGTRINAVTIPDIAIKTYISEKQTSVTGDWKFVKALYLLAADMIDLDEAAKHQLRTCLDHELDGVDTIELRYGGHHRFPVHLKGGQGPDERMVAVPLPVCPPNALKYKPSGYTGRSPS